MYGLSDEFKVFNPPSTTGFGKLEPNYVDAYKAWKDQDSPQTRAQMLTAVQPVLSKAIKTYGSGDNRLMQSHAKLIALKALPQYDPQRGRLDTHLLSHLQGLQRIAGKQQQLIKIPERLVIDHSKLEEQEKELEDRLGRPPSAAELQRATGLSRKRIAKIRQVQPGLTSGSLPPGEEGEPAEIASQAIGDTRNQDAWLDFVYEDLGPTDQYIMESMLGLYGRRVKPVQNIAKTLGITPSAVSQRAAKIQKMIDQQKLVFGG